MQRKWVVLGVTVSALALVTTALPLLAADESPLAKIMEKVNAKNGAIRKNTRTAVAYKKASKDVVKDANELVKLAKDARAIKDSATKQKKPYEQWTKLMDDFIGSATKLAEVADSEKSTQKDASDAFRKMGTTCTNCHNEFRVEEDELK